MRPLPFSTKYPQTIDRISIDGEYLDLLVMRPLLVAVLSHVKGHGMRHSHCYKIATLLLALSMLPACSSHWGRSEVKPALLKIYQMQSQSAVTVERIDGRQSAGKSPLLIAPGAHAIELRLQSSAAPSSASCIKTLGFNQFKSEQIYTVGQGIWNDVPSLMLKSARGEILASADISDCAA